MMRCAGWDGMGWDAGADADAGWGKAAVEAEWLTGWRCCEAPAWWLAGVGPCLAAL